MLVNKWWVQKNILCSGLDPGKVLGRVADHLGDEYTPMIYMTGDGHRTPAFQWTTRGVWPEFFSELARMNSICCHVEKFSDAVVKNDVPPILAPVFNNNKVFGWEPDFFKKIHKIMETCLAAVSKEKINMTEMGIITNGLRQLSDENILIPEAQRATELLLSSLDLRKEEFSLIEIEGLAEFLMTFSGRRAMALRTEIHATVGSIIQRNIDRYADHIHLITCGDAHITCTDPLYKHIDPTIGTFGVADEMNA